MKKRVVSFIVLLAAVFLMGGSTSEKRVQEIDNTDIESASTATPEPTATPKPEPTEEPVEEFSDEWSKIIPWADLDGDGTEEYIFS